MDQYYDVAIIGAGPGGYVAAIRSAQLGLKTVCIDKAELGGTCLNIGCIPSKSLLQSTELYAKILHAKEHGIQVSDLSYNLPQMMKRKEEVVKSLVNGVEWLFQRHHVDFIQGTAQFTSADHLEIKRSDGSTSTLQAQSIILATGSEPIPLPQLPFDEKQIVSSTGALSLTKVPQRMAVIGGGAVGLEIASVYARLGTDVTVIEMLDKISPAMDEAISHTLLQILKKQGIHFLLPAQVVSGVVQPDEMILTINHQDKLQNLSVEVVLVSIGRRPYTQGLGLEAAGIRTNAKGFVIVDNNFRTNLPHVFAIGDLIEGAMLAHRASEEGVALAESLAGLKSAVRYMTVPNVIYTDPEAASVGLTEAEARSIGLKIKIGSCPFRGNPRARCMGETEGFAKIIGEAETGRVIGLHILGPHASELIEEGMMAIQKGATLEEVAHAPHAHPTLSEAIQEAAQRGVENF